MTCGIYQIQNKINKKRYIGQSHNIEKRWNAHCSLLNNNIHHNSHLQNAWNKYGAFNFVFSVIEECNIEDLDNRETYWINYFNTLNDGYNLTEGGGGIYGFRKGYYRVIKKGMQNEDRRYQLVDKDSRGVITSTLEDVLQYYCDLLNNGEISQKEAKKCIEEKNEQYWFNKKNKIFEQRMKNITVEDLIIQSSQGLSQQDIINKLNVSKSYFQNFLKKHNIVWRDVYFKGEEYKIQQYDKINNIQQQLLKGHDIKDIAAQIPCSQKQLNQYRKKNNIQKLHKRQNGYLYGTNTGVRYLSLLKTGEWQYRRTHQNPNNITRIHFNDIKNVVHERGYLWIIDNEDKLQKALQRDKHQKTIKHNIINGKKIAKNRLKNKKKQNFLHKRALKIFRKMFFIPKPKKTQKSPTGVTRVTFSRGGNNWLYNKPNTRGYIQRHNLEELKKEVLKQQYKWIIEDEILFQQVQEEVRIYQNERKKPFDERQYPDFQFI